jgi:hypothetical protein
MGLFEDLVRKKLEEYLPQLDIIADKKLINICTEDFRLYLMHKWNFESQLKGVEFREKFLDAVDNEGNKILPYVDIWIQNWIEQWRKKVKLITKEEDWTRDKRQVSKLVRRGENKLSPMKVEEFKWPIITTMIDNGNIVCLGILSDQLLKRELGKYKGLPNKWSIKDELQYLNFIMGKAKDIVTTNRYLVYIKLGENYFRNL